VGLVAVAREISTIEEKLPEHSCLFQTGDYRNEGYNSEKLSWVRSPTKKFSVDRELSTTEERPQEKVVRFGEKIIEAKATKL
jgi:hypothetical protein